MQDLICNLTEQPQHDSFRSVIIRKLLIIAGIEVNPGPKRGYFELLKNNQNAEINKKARIIEQQEAPGTSNGTILARVQNLEQALVQKEKLIKKLRKDLQEVKEDLLNVKRSLRNRNENEDNSENNVTFSEDDSDLGLFVDDFPSIAGLNVFTQAACELGDWRACWYFLQDNIKDGLLFAELNICNTEPIYTSNILKEAVLKGSLELIALFLKNGFPVNHPIDNNNKNTLIHVAAQNSKLSVVDYLLRNNADVHVKSAEGFTALHHAAQNNQVDVVRRVLHNGAFIDAQDNIGKTPLHIAFLHGYPAVAKLLLDEGCNPRIPDISGKTAICEVQLGLPSFTN